MPEATVASRDRGSAFGPWHLREHDSATRRYATGISTNPSHAHNTPRGCRFAQTQTTSPLAARCQRFSPRWSAMWAPHHRKLRAHRHQSGGIALHGGSTRRRHAARRLRVVQNPHRHQPEVRRVTYKTGAGPLCAKNFAQHQPSSDISAKNFAQQAQKRRIWANLSAQGELFRAFTI